MQLLLQLVVRSPFEILSREGDYTIEKFSITSPFQP